MNFSNHISLKFDNYETRIIPVLLCLVSIVNITGDYMASYIGLVTFMAIFLLGYCLINYKCLLSNNNIGLSIFFLIFSLSMLYSNFSNRRIQYTAGITIYRQVLQYVLPFFVLIIIKEKQYFTQAVEQIWKTLVVAVIVTDVHALLTGAKYRSLIGSYLIGNKFTICYLHFYMLGFFMYFWDSQNVKDRIKMIVMCAVSFAIAVYSECSTAIIGMVIFFVLYILKDKIWKRMQNPLFAFAVMLISNLTLIVFPAVLNLGPVRYVVINVLGEDPSLTGRMIGYTRMYAALIYNPLWGVGYYNNYAASRYFTNMDNLQNGLADVALSFGIVGVVFLIAILFIAFIHGAGDRSIGFMLIVYMFIIISSVEITLNMKFLVMLAFVMFSEKEKLGDKCENSNIIHAKSY